MIIIFDLLILGLVYLIFRNKEGSKTSDCSTYIILSDLDKDQGKHESVPENHESIYQDDSEW